MKNFITEFLICGAVLFFVDSIFSRANYLGLALPDFLVYTCTSYTTYKLIQWLTGAKS